MTAASVPGSSRFTKSLSNARTERQGLGVLLRDGRFQWVGTPTKRRIIELIGTSATFGIQTFDVVMTPEPESEITVSNVESCFPRPTLVEMKVTKKPIRNAALNGFFFGATERERAMARALGDKYLLAFVVLSEANEYGRPFAVLLGIDELEVRTKPWRVQYQVNFKTDTVVDDIDPLHQLVILGSESDLADNDSMSPVGDELDE